MNRVIVLGGSGMLGSMVVDQLARTAGFRVTATVRTEALAVECRRRVPGVNWQLFDAVGVGSCVPLSVLEGHDWVINAIGITKPLIHDDNAFEIERAVRINVVLPNVIGKWAQRSGARVLQIATDCVFSGSKGRYLEDDPHDALDVYGKTKSLGEVWQPDTHHLRCSVIGPEPKEHKFLLDWFRLRQPSAKLSGYTNHRWNGITTLHFAKVCCGIISRGIALRHLQHVVPTGEITKYEMLQCFAKGYGRDDLVIAPAEAAYTIDRSLGTANEGLNLELWESAGYPRPPSVTQMIEELAAYDYRMLLC